MNSRPWVHMLTYVLPNTTWKMPLIVNENDLSKTTFILLFRESEYIGETVSNVIPVIIFVIKIKVLLKLN